MSSDPLSVTSGTALSWHEFGSAPVASPWLWQDQGQIVAWRSGELIAFREEIRLATAEMVDEGLPRFGAIVWLLAACRDDAMVGINAAMASIHSAYLSQAKASAVLLDDIPRRLEIVHQAWRQLKFKHNAKARLLASIIAPIPRWQRIAISRAELNQRFADAGKVWRGRVVGTNDSWASLRSDLLQVYFALSGASVDGLVSRFETGLDDALEPTVLEAELPPALSLRDSLREWQDDSEIGGVARIAQMLLASIHLPRAVSDPDQLPDGGLCDIVNRGPLDRLLLSELAHDDATLAVRIAMNEALYLRREAPPSPPPRKRQILIDTGLRLWGVPRIYATAVAMAVMASEEKRYETGAYQTSHGKPVEVDLKTRAGVISALACLDGRIDPLPPLAELRAQGDENEANTKATRPDATDTILVTSEETLNDPAFLTRLTPFLSPPLIIAAVDRLGRLRIESHGRAGTRLLHQCTLDLAALLAPRPKTKTGAKPKLNSPLELPAIFRTTHFPLLLSTGNRPPIAWEVEEGKQLSLAKDGRLLLWIDAEHGGGQIAEGIHPNALLLHRTYGVKHFAVLGDVTRGTGTAITFDRQTHQVHVATLDWSGAQGAAQLAMQNNVLIAIGLVNALVLSLSDGEILASKPIRPGARRLGGRFVWGDYRVFAGSKEDDLPPSQTAGIWGASWNDGKLDWHRVPRLPDSRAIVQKVLDVGERGPAMVLDNHTVEYAGDKSIYDYRVQGAKIGSVLTVAPDGERFACFVSQHQFLVVDAVNRNVAWRYGQLATVFQNVDPRWNLVNATGAKHDLRRNLRGIGADSLGRIALLSRNHVWFAIEVVQGKLMLRPTKNAIAGFREFEDWPGDEAEAERYRLKVARWSNGASATLDARGLLHLKRGDAKLPECTLALCEREMAAWTSDGEWFGGDYFTGRDNFTGGDRHPTDSQSRRPSPDATQTYIIDYGVALPQSAKRTFSGAVLEHAILRGFAQSIAQEPANSSSIEGDKP